MDPAPEKILGEGPGIFRKCSLPSPQAPLPTRRRGRGRRASIPTSPAKDFTGFWGQVRTYPKPIAYLQVLHALRLSIPSTTPRYFSWICFWSNSIIRRSISAFSASLQ